MHQGCVAGVNEGGEGAAGWWPTSPSSVGREEYYTRELATDHEQYLSGHGESQAGGTARRCSWACRAKHRWPGSRPCSRAATPRLGSCWVGRMAATPCPPLMWCCGRLRACRSSTASGIRPPAGRCWPRIMLGWPRRSATWMSTLALGVVTAVSSMCPDTVLAVGFDHRTSREGDPLLHSHLVIANRVQGPDGRWTALDGRDLYRHRLAADAIYRATYQRELARTLAVEWTPADTHGNRELQGMPEALVRSFSKRASQIDAELDRLVEDGRERTPGWSSGRSRPPARPSSMRPRTP